MDPTNKKKQIPVSIDCKAAFFPELRIGMNEKMCFTGMTYNDEFK